MADYVTMTELISQTGISKTTLYRLKDEGLPCIRVGTKTLYEPNLVMDFVNQRKDVEFKVEVGKIYSNQEICEAFRVGSMGGIRKSNSKRAIVTIAYPHNQSFKHYDYWVDDTLYFYGQGSCGNQDMSIGFNRSLAEAPNTGYTIYLFEKIDVDQYLYRGIVELEAVEKKKGIGSDGIEREEILFLLKLKGQQDLVTDAILEKEERAAEIDAMALSRKEVISVAKEKSEDLPGFQRRIIYTVNRPSAVIRRYVLMRAQGYCELCKKKAPFEVKGEPFLEIDHIIPIAQGGTSSIDNLAALCPNCHRMKHAIGDEEQIKELQRAISRDERRLQKLLHLEEE